MLNNFSKYTLFLLIFCFFYNCKNVSSETDHQEIDIDTVIATDTTQNQDEEFVFDYKTDSIAEHEINYVTNHILIIDTSYNYNELRETMMQYSADFDYIIDTLNRFFDVEQNLIRLPDDDEDEIYAGDYIPRRFGNDFLSIDYLPYYDTTIHFNSFNVSKMAIIAGFFEKEEETQANEFLTKIKKQYPSSYIHTTEIYVGCIH